MHKQTHTAKSHKSTHTHTHISISPLVSANYEQDSYEEETYTSLNLAFFHSHTVSQWSKTQWRAPHHLPPGEIPEYQLLFQLLQVVCFSYSFFFMSLLQTPSENPFTWIPSLSHLK